MWFKFRNQCRCGTPQMAAEDPIAPVRFDARWNTYHIDGEGVLEGEPVKVSLLVQYCFRCGGRMPAAKHGAPGPKVDRKEKAALYKLLERVRDEASMREVLGEPDSVRDYQTDAYTRMLLKAGRPGVTAWRKVYTYRSRFEKIAFDIYVAEDGSLRCTPRVREPEAEAEEGVSEPGVAPDADGAGS